MSSIRVRLLVSLLALLALAAAAMAAFTYRTVLGETEAIFDYQLQQMALSLRDQGEIASAQADSFADAQLDFVIQIWTIDGRTIYASRAHASLPQRALLGLHTLIVEGNAWRTYSVATRERVIQVAQPIEIRQRLAARSAWRSVLPLLLMAPFAALAIWWLAAQNLKPLDRLAREVRARDARSLASLPTAGLPDEVAPLADALNALLERLRSSLDAQRAFVADAAHELRSPLTALKLQLELLRREGDADGREAARAALSEGIARASRLVEQLLALARAEPDAAAPAEHIDLVAVARQAVAETLPFAQSRAVEFALVAAAPAFVLGDGSRAEVRVGSDAAGVLLQVDDSGPGIAEEERERVFDRFYRRADRGETGSGLGLAIVRSVALAHGATVALSRSTLGGLRAEVRFPAAAS
jgi:two-component system OmpR family sensor kinase/two-component system sensor histidine kinase QseC